MHRPPHMKKGSQPCRAGSRQKTLPQGSRARGSPTPRCLLFILPICLPALPRCAALEPMATCHRRPHLVLARSSPHPSPPQHLHAPPRCATTRYQRWRAEASPDRSSPAGRLPSSAARPPPSPPHTSGGRANKVSTGGISRPSSSRSVALVG
jgi:hypothetical protein